MTTSGIISKLCFVWCTLVLVNASLDSQHSKSFMSTEMSKSTQNSIYINTVPCENNADLKTGASKISDKKSQKTSPKLIQFTPESLKTKHFEIEIPSAKSTSRLLRKKATNLGFDTTSLLRKQNDMSLQLEEKLNTLRALSQKSDRTRIHTPEVSATQSPFQAIHDLNEELSNRIESLMATRREHYKSQDTETPSMIFSDIAAFQPNEQSFIETNYNEHNSYNANISTRIDDDKIQDMETNRSEHNFYDADIPTESQQKEDLEEDSISLLRVRKTNEELSERIHLIMGSKNYFGETQISTMRESRFHDKSIQLNEQSLFGNAGYSSELNSEMEELLFDNDTTPLGIQQAVQMGDIDIVPTLLAFHENIESKDVFGNTALYYCAERDQVKTVWYLFLLGADVNSRCSWGKTALHIAAEYGHYSTVEMLLYLHANVNAQADYRRTPLFLASQNGHVGVIKLLIQYGADLKVKDTLGRTAMNIADSETARDIMTYVENDRSIERFLESKFDY